MALTSLRITPRQEQSLRTLCEQSPEYLEDAYTRLAMHKEHIVSPKVLRAALEQPLVPGLAQILVQQLIALRSYIDHSHISVSEAVGRLSLRLRGEKLERRYF
jgi:hypothetical protein